ncbi:hypothetical protein IMCC3317_12820 [Kordia antarctica]|uniref:Uncharacterized protein n=1 Tax=Kordia antarctica TaxID=1218801 RepID=A0A7L4ZJ30_9FLAO|nr:hypothetical protein [Kordia antarctica]QHI35934.1 hypothetical protein IMCC3317_12820 [Kordia antarctica]
MEIKRQLMVHNMLPEGSDALTINSGTTHHSKQKTATVNYKGVKFTPEFIPQAYVNKKDWRQLTAKELACLAPNEDRNDFNTIYLGEIPEALQACFETLHLVESTNRDEVFDRLEKDPPAIQKATELLNEFLLPKSNSKKFNFHCIGVNHPNLELVASNTTMLAVGHKESVRKLLGLHNDGTQLMTIKTAHEFGNRISINLGKDPRYFLFVNLHLMEAYKMLQERMSADEFMAVNITNIPAYFFSHFPDYPVLKVQQKQYQYYIAATDNCFHDGSTLGNKNLDITMVYFGSFQY